MQWVQCPKCGRAVTTNSSSCHCGYSFVAKNMPTLSYKAKFELHDWQWFLCKEPHLEKKWNLQRQLQKLASIAAEEVGSWNTNAMYHCGCSTIESIQMSGARAITIRLRNTVASTPACALFAILNELEHIEHPTNCGKWSIYIETSQYIDPQTRMYSRIGLPGYFSLIYRLNDWVFGGNYPNSYEDPTRYAYNEECAELTLYSGEASSLPIKCRNARKLTIGPDVVSVPDNLFRGFQYLEEIFISPNVYGIGASAFADCPELKVVHFPDSICEIGSSAFAGCVRLKTLNIHSARPLRIGSHAFSLCPATPTCNQSINAVLDCLSDIRAEIENEDISALMDNSSKPFFTDSQPILIDGSGNRDDDLKEAMRRMDLFFSTVPYLKKYSNNVPIQGTWFPPRTYCHIFFSKVYFHSHDGECISQTDISVHRITAQKYYEGKSASVNDSYFSNAWLPDSSIAGYESERYYLSETRFRAKNFLGMRGFFEVNFRND